MSDYGSPRSKPPVVLAVAAGVVLLGIIAWLGLFWSNSQNDSEELDDYARWQEQMASHVQWDVDSYVVDPSRECEGFGGYLDVHINVTNVSQQAIIEGSGFVLIDDLFGNEMLVLAASIDTPLSSGETATIGSTGEDCWGLDQLDNGDLLKEMADPYSSTNVRFFLVSITLESGETIFF